MCIRDRWGAGDRPEELLEDDISQGNLYVLEDAVADEAIIHAVFAFIEGEDPVYLKIEQGSWMVDTEYAAVHRVASDGTVRNVLEKIMDYCKAQIPHLRIDTHEDNKVMQHVLEKYGFVRCGIVYVSDGSPRIAVSYTHLYCSPLWKTIIRFPIMRLKMSSLRRFSNHL